jgi:hypothetical protein
MNHQREHVRRLLQAAASVTDEDKGRTWHAQIIDISRMGVAFITSEQLVTDDHFHFSFMFPGTNFPCEAVIKMVYSRPVGETAHFRNGARFVEISDSCVEQIVDYVTSGVESQFTPAY